MTDLSDAPVIEEKTEREAKQVEPSRHGPVGTVKQPLAFDRKPAADQRNGQFAHTEQRHEGTPAEIQAPHHRQHVFGNSRDGGLIKGRHQPPTEGPIVPLSLLYAEDPLAGLQ